MISPPLRSQVVNPNLPPLLTGILVSCSVIVRTDSTDDLIVIDMFDRSTFLVGRLVRHSLLLLLPQMSQSLT